jgi:hypothetical protein
VTATLLAAAMLVAAPAANGQSAADQYIPKLDPADSTGISPGLAPPASAASPDNPTAPTRDPKPQAAPRTDVDDGSGGGGDAPGTDFPLTPFVLALLGLAAIVLVGRALRPLVARGP